jgi:cobalt-zinc-cadmium efflux system membrane fusion protein
MNALKTPMLAALLAALLLAGCDRKPAAGGHDAKVDAKAAAHDEHGPEPEKLTDFSDQTELYLEFPPLVAGQTATFVVHLTQLTDFKPLAQGKVSVVLSSAAGEERFASDTPVVPGIFKPVGAPKAAGERELSLVVESALGRVVHELGPVQVYGDAGSAATAHAGHDHGDPGIAFGKEQQWKIDFATAEAVKGKVRPSVVATATIKGQPDSEARLVAPAAGTLRAAGSFPRVGQTVKQGQVLALFAPKLGGDTDQATLDAAAGKAKIALDQARRERERMEALFKDEAVAEKRLLEARANEQVAAAEVQAAQARQGQLGGAGGIAIRAPVAGLIADVGVAPGAFVAEGAGLFHIADTRRLWLEARVPESEVGKLGTPSGASFSVDGYAQPFVIEPGKNGRLVAVGGVVDAATRTVPAIFEFANPDGALRLGMTAKARLYAGAATEAVLVPAGSVQDESGTQVVYVQTGGENFERRLVRVGARDGDQVAILDGLQPGQRVVSKGGYLIRLSTSMSAAVGHTH